MTSKIKVDNIENQCGGAVVTKCGGTTTITGSVVKANNIQASDAGNIISQSGTTITLGASGDTISLASGASQTGFGRTGTVDWITTPKTATFSAVSGEGYFCNTSGGAFTVNLPAGSAGAIVSLADYAATWLTNNVTVSPNGTDKIGSVNASVTLNTEGQSVTLVYVDSTQGWINTMDSTSNVRGRSFVTATVSGACNTLVTAPCCSNAKIATFVGPGTFCVSQLSSETPENIITYMTVAGGAGGGSALFGNGISGGGAGGFREVKNPVTPYTSSPLEGFSTPANQATLTVQGYPIVVGAGGTQGGPYGPVGSPSGGAGNPTSAFGITAAGGGQGGQYSGAGSNGGSGGGGGDISNQPGGSGNTPPVSPPQGNDGGSGFNNSPTNTIGGSGGGAGGAGIPGNPAPGGGGTKSGGAGVASSITSSSVTYSEGGDSKGWPVSTSCVGPAGGANTGDAGNGSAIGGAGGSGIVIIRYKFQ